MNEATAEPLFPRAVVWTTSPGRWRGAWPWYALPWCAALACLALRGLAGPTASETVARWALGASVLLCGLPHGSADWWVLRLAAGARWRGGTLALLLGGYVLASLLTLAFWRWQPGLALAGFLVLTVWHFGSADATVLLPGSRPLRGLAWWLFAWGRGLLVIGAPLAFHPGEATRLLEPFVALNGAADATVPRLLRFALPLAILGFGWCLAGASCRCAREPGSMRLRRFARHALESFLLAALFWLTPPLLGFTGYWVAFHAWRHLLRVESLLHPGPRLPLGQALLDFHRRTLPLTLLSLLGLGLILWLWPPLSRDGGGWTTAYFILLSALTVPHALVIGWLDARQPSRP